VYFITDNPLKKSAAVWFVFGIIGFVLIFVPGLVGIEGMSGGFAISLFCLFLGIIGIVGGVVYAMYASILDRTIRGDRLLAHWTYPPEEWRKYAEKEYVEDKAEKKGLFIVISVFALVFGFLFWAFDPEDGFYVLLMMLGLIALIGFVWLFSSWFSHRQNLRSVGEVYISKGAVYLNRSLHTWAVFGSSLNDVSLKTIRGLKMLVFDYSALTYPPRSIAVRVPVPGGQEDVAETIVQQFASA
jgi:hypothetical protein